MADGTLGTTNALLWALVAIGVLEAVALAIVVVVTIRMQARALEALREVQQQLRPLTERANDLAAVVESIAADVKTATARAKSGAEKAGMAFQTAVDVVQVVRGTARASVMSRAIPLLGIARGLLVAYRSFAGGRGPSRPGSSKVRRPGSGQRTPETILDSSPTINQITEAVHGT